ncbi:hypothetical protein [Allorhizocola rhizosphaerae]|uniref:hypothetical protein n=1 Tax=Allorhizocola rhizosphaerae TaxID=1872709 RepID=UPI000E3B80F2|nr:hypothetical protein [Allorhizocola rhizosphaerae]
MKLAIVPAIALAAGGAALMASPANATPEVSRHSSVGHTASSVVKPHYDHVHGWYNDGKDDDHGDICYTNHIYPGFNILSGTVLNDAIDAPIDVIVQVITLLTMAEIQSDKPINNEGCF